MTETLRRFFSADSLERAVLDAASHYGIEPERLAYEPVEKRGLKRRKVVIRVDPEAPVRGDEPAPTREEQEKQEKKDPGVAARAPEPAVEASEPEPEPEPEPGPEPEPEPQRREPETVLARGAAPPRSERGATPAPLEVRLPRNVEEWFELLPEADVEERVAAERWATALLELADLDLTPRVRQGEEQLEISLRGPDAEWLADDDGEVLLALQHLLPRLMQSDLERLVSCRVDCGGFQLLKEERLRARAHWAAEEVRSEGRSVTLEPMPPADRRIIHLALVNDSSVDTESLGRGYFKRVSVRPS